MYILILDVASVLCIDATAEVYCLQGAHSIYSDLSTNHGNYDSWNECDIIQKKMEKKNVYFGDYRYTMTILMYATFVLYL